MLAVRQKRSEFERQALVHADALYGAAYRLTRNPRDAEDLVQDALLRAYKFWDSFQQDSNCKAWLLRIVTNTFINEYQRRKRSREVLDAASAEQDATDGVLVHASAGDKQSPDQAMLAASVSDDVQRALDQLPDDFRTAVILCDMQGLSYKEIAEIMETPVGTVMSRLFRGRKLLAAALKEFALAEGYVRSDAASEAKPVRGRRAKGASSDASDAANRADETNDETNNETIDLEKYRAAKTAREGSR
jgi:RNA polymerase sigma-70 factor, ECF subfamily